MRASSARALDVDGRESAHRDRGGQAGDHRVGAHEAAQRDRRRRLEILDRAGLRARQAGGQPVAAHADADVPEVLVAGAALPHAAGADEHPDHAGFGMAPGQRLAAACAGLVDVLADLVQVAEVVLAFLVELGGLVCRRRGWPANMPTIDKTIIIGNIIVIGLLSSDLPCMVNISPSSRRRRRPSRPA